MVFSIIAGILIFIFSGPTISGGVSELYSLMGRNQFLIAAYFLLVGHQLIFQCDWPSLATTIIQSFKVN